MKDKKSPLKSKPLRQAGQSIREEIDKRRGKIIEHYLFCAMFTIFAIHEWWTYFENIPRSRSLSLVYTVIAGFLIIFFLIKLMKEKKTIKNLELGLDGEKVVSEEIEKLRTIGCSIFHDILGENFNIDHVIVSDKGIFVLETKTYSKPRSGESTVTFNGKKLMIDGIGDRSEILTQVKAASTWLGSKLEESTGKKFLVKPVILFPGWWVNSNEKADIWVLEPKQLDYHLRRKKPVLSLEETRMAALHLRQYIRTL